MEILRNNFYKSIEEVPEIWGGFYWSNSILNYKSPKKAERVNNNWTSLWRKCFNYNMENMLSNKELYSKANEAKSKGLALLGKFYVNHMGNTYFTNVYLVPVNSSHNYDRVKLIGEYDNIGIAEALSKSNVRWVPEIIMGNGGNGGSAMDAVGLNMMLDVVNKMNKK